MSKPEEIVRALDELESALEEFRAAYTAWLGRDGDGDAASVKLLQALSRAEARLDHARALLATAGE